MTVEDRLLIKTSQTEKRRIVEIMSVECSETVNGVCCLISYE